MLRRGAPLPVLHAVRTSGSCRRPSPATIRSIAATRSCCRIVPKDRRKPYNMRKLIGHVVDRGFGVRDPADLRQGADHLLARMNGRVVGVVANNPMVYGGAMDVKAARKQIHFVELCDCFHIPLVFLVDVPGFMVGREAEAAATLREGMRAVYVGLQATVPIIHRRDPQVLRHGRHGHDRQERAGFQDRLAVGRMGLAADRGRRGRRLPPRDRRARPTPRRASARSRPNCAPWPRRSAPPRRSASRRSSIRARRAPYLCRFIDAAQAPPAHDAWGQKQNTACVHEQAEGNKQMTWDDFGGR